MSAILNYQKLKRHLIGYYGYSELTAIQAIDRIRHMNPNIKKDFYSWFQTGELPDHFINGIDLDALIAYRGMNPVSAFLYVDWYGREPEQAYQVMAIQFKDMPPSVNDLNSAVQNMIRMGVKTKIEENSEDISV